MSQYFAPIESMRFIINEMVGIGNIAELPGYEEVTPDIAMAILEEAGKFAREVLAPLNRVGGIQGCRLLGKEVVTPEGWQKAYEAFCAGGWASIAAPVEFGGQNLPKLVSAAVMEMWQASNLGFSLMPLLSTGACEALLIAGSKEIKQKYLPKMVSGQWGGTMNLTEPQAGSDLAALRARAELASDGSYRIFGQKIFITYGEHELTENIIHLVLARLPDAPPGVKGISLFVVPKFLVDEDGSLGERNDVHCVSLEHKLGIHASPTCVMAYGDADGAVGYLVGERNRGLVYMFIMMNEARFGVGMQGVATAERALQQALAYANERVQGRDAVTGRNGVTIASHPDVRRMLLLMQSRTEAARMLAYWVAGQFDFSHAHPDPAVREKSGRLVDFLIPIVKGWNTEIGNDSVSLGVQVHGGMGFIEETGAAQHLRDARIQTIYEGTTGVQANDLLVRKMLRDGGVAMSELLELMRADLVELKNMEHSLVVTLLPRLEKCLAQFETAGRQLMERASTSLGEAMAVAVPFLMLAGTTCGAWQWGRASMIAAQRLNEGAEGEAFYRSRLELARFYMTHVATTATGLAETVAEGTGVWDLAR